MGLGSVQMSVLISYVSVQILGAVSSRSQLRFGSSGLGSDSVRLTWSNRVNSVNDSQLLVNTGQQKSRMVNWS
ncbi:hypothetical protein HanRHA438_Chr09g0421391 [Helianthus annuus]|nr:hypothetical protein HanRHA438_Chr09g0421391 [Helianthus annuus]